MTSCENPHYFGEYPFRLISIRCYLPSIVADADIHPSARNSPKDLGSRVLDLLQRLFEWRWAWERVYGGCAYEMVTDPSSSLTLDENGGPLFPTILYYTNPILASCIAFYNAGLIFLSKIAKQQFGEYWWIFVDTGQPSDLARPAQKSVLLLPPDLRSAEDATQELCRSIEFHLSREETIASDAFRLVTPLALACNAIPKQSREAKWLRRICDQMSEMTGFQIFRYSNLLPEGEQQDES